MKNFSTIMVVMFIAHLNAQVSQVTLSLQQAENIFLQKNLELLATQYNISMNDALIIQARAYPNPLFTADFNVYDPQHNKVFHVDSSGQKAFALQQMLLLGGKRRLDIDIAKQNKAIAEAEFSELLQQLKLELNNSFFSIREQKRVIQNFDVQMATLDTIIDAYNSQAAKGNIPLKDVVRLKSVYIKLNNNRSELTASRLEEQKKLKLILQLSTDVQPVFEEDTFKRFMNLRPLNDLNELALNNRPELKIADISLLQAELYLRRRRAERVPDLMINAGYDQRGGAFRNQVNAGFTLQLPVLNTNRGNIKAAAFSKMELDAYAAEKKLEVELDVQQAWLSMERCIAEYQKVRNLFDEQFNKVNEGYTENFQRRNVSILEFVDFVESFNESFAEFERVKTRLAMAAARVNFVTASKIY
jgi:cobalt-zinc-cadmium efflux system outer membrane protein